VGAFQAVSANQLRPGDRVAVLIDEANPSAGFTAATVDKVDHVLRHGTYLPAIEKPYIVANGLVTPL